MSATTGQVVKTGKVTGRRTLRFKNVDDVMAEAGRVTHQPMRPLGNWSVGEILDHLARSIQASFAGSAPPAPWIARTFIAPFVKKSMLTKGLPAGFKLPPTMAAFQPRLQIAAVVALEDLHAATARLMTESPGKSHPFFGRLTHDEWINLHLRHAELHLSFLIPE